jgi:NAD(P)-dependent dehydrogenase (short-subunit alcohol dehydrogenase family)
MRKTIVITGGTGGIGLQSAIALVRQGARVVVTGRDEARGAAGLARIRRESGNADVHLVLGDLARPGEIPQLAAAIAARFPAVDVLINSAAVLTTGPQRLGDFELSFAVNVAAPCLLSRALMPDGPYPLSGGGARLRNEEARVTLATAGLARPEGVARVGGVGQVDHRVAVVLDHKV